MQVHHSHIAMQVALKKHVRGGYSTMQATLFAMLFAVVIPQAHSATITLTFPEANGIGSTSSSVFPLPPVSVGSPLPFTLASGEYVASVSVAGSFGNTLTDNSSPVDVFINGARVASCDGASQCHHTGGPYPWNFFLSPSALASGVANLTYAQTGAGFVRLGTTTLTIATAAAAAQTIALGAPPSVRVNGSGKVTASTTASPSANYPITFQTGSAAACSVTSTGVVRGIKAGSNNCVITANQIGDNKYAAASATQTFSIGQDATTLTLSATPNPAFSGTPVTITATLAGDPPTGSVTFCEGASTANSSCTGGKTLCVASLVAGTANSIASCPVTFTGNGQHSLSAYYAGDNNYFATVTAQALIETIGAIQIVPAPMLTHRMLLLLGVLMLLMACALGKKKEDTK